MIRPTITTLLLATSFWAPITHAADPPAPKAAVPVEKSNPPPTLDRTIVTSQLPGFAEINRAAEAQGLHLRQMVSTGDLVDVTVQARDGQTGSLIYELRPSTSAVTRPPTPPRIVLSAPLAPAFLDDDAALKWETHGYPSIVDSDSYPSITFRFDFHRNPAS